MFRRPDAFCGLLLKPVNDPDLVRELNRIEDPVSVAPKCERDFKYARAKPAHGFGNVRLATSAAIVSAARQTNFAVLALGSSRNPSMLP